MDQIVTHTAATVPTLKAPIYDTMKDRVSNTRLYRVWAIPGLLDKDSIPLEIAAFLTVPAVLPTTDAFQQQPGAPARHQSRVTLRLYCKTLS